MNKGIIIFIYPSNFTHYSIQAFFDSAIVPSMLWPCVTQMMKIAIVKAGFVEFPMFTRAFPLNWTEQCWSPLKQSIELDLRSFLCSLIDSKEPPESEPCCGLPYTVKRKNLSPHIFWTFVVATWEWEEKYSHSKYTYSTKARGSKVRGFHYFVWPTKLIFLTTVFAFFH